MQAVVLLVFLIIIIVTFAILLKKLSKTDTVNEEAKEETKEEISLHEVQKAEKKKRKDEEREQKERIYKIKEEARSLKQDKYEAKIKERELAREKVLQQEAIEKEIQKKKEQDIYEEWKKEFVVEPIVEDIEDPNRLQLFIEYIKTNRFVDLQKLCNEFNLLSSEAVDRIKKLETDNRIQGIFDSRGAYIYFSEEELIKINRHIKEAGMVTKKQMIDYCDTIFQDK